MEHELLLGADVGGTSTRMLIADTDARILGGARGGAGNPKSVGPSAAADQISSVFAECLARCSPPVRRSQLGAVTLGLAGLTGLDDVASFVGRALPGLDPDLVRVLPDFVVAFASGTADQSGFVVLSGTGAGAMRIEDGEVTGRRDAWGWLLGDAGSGYWLGREAVRATLTELECGQSPGPLSRAVLSRTGSSDFDSLLAAAYARPPLWLAELAPTITQNVTLDPVAARISEQAASLLLDALLSLGPEPGRVVVTTGSVLSPDSPVRTSLARAIGRQLDNPVRSAKDGLGGALWMALCELAQTEGRGERAEDFHARLLTAVRAATPA